MQFTSQSSPSATAANPPVAPATPTPQASVLSPEFQSLYLCPTPIDMRLGFDGVLARVIHWFGCARPHCAYAFVNKRGNRIKLIVHDGLGLWLAQRRLHSGRQFAWIDQPSGQPMKLSDAQWRALHQGLPWSGIEQAITGH